MPTFTGYPAVHERVMSPLELRALDDRRRRLLARASGDVLEIGGGTGAHLDAYDPARVTRVRIAGPDPVTAPLLRRRAEHAPVPVELLDQSLDDLAAAGEHADTVVTQLALCAVSDLDATVLAAAQLIGDDGVLLFFEHVPAPKRPLGGLVTALVRPAWLTATAGCRLERDTPSALRRLGFTVIDIERFTMPTLVLPIRHAVMGVARVSRPGYPGARPTADTHDAPHRTPHGRPGAAS